MKRLPILATACLGAFNVTVLAIPMKPETIPVDQLVKMADAKVQKEPQNAEAHYTLARIHYFAFVCGAKKLQAYTRIPDSPAPIIGPFQRFTTANDGALFKEAEKRALVELNLKEHPPFNSAKGKEMWDRIDAIANQLEKSGWRPADSPTGKLRRISKER